MIKEHACSILRAAENISGNVVDCIGKGECNDATNCILMRKHGSWDNLVQYFVRVANEARRFEDGVFREGES